MSVSAGPTSRRHTRNVVFSDLGVLALLALALLALHMLTNGQYGFHRDELATLDEGRFLAWGYVEYPPLAPFIARLGRILFGPSLVGLRFFSAAAQSIAILLAGLIAQSLGGSRWAQCLTALAAAIGPDALTQGAMFQYTSYDYMWWVLLALLVVRLLKSGEGRWWLGIGAVVGLGMMTKYTMILLVAGVVGGVVGTRARRYLTSPWLWAGVMLSLLIVLPNLIWQLRHDIISLDFFRSIHARDVRIGRTNGFVLDQFVSAASVVTVPMWLAGLYWYLFRPEGQRYRVLGWMYLIPLAVLLILKGRGYYLAPAYPMLIAAGLVLLENCRLPLSTTKAQVVQWAMVTAIAIGGIAAGALALPIAPINSTLWKVTAQIHDDFKEQLGWPELIQTVAGVYNSEPAIDKPHVAILTGNYGEAGAINLYGPGYKLPQAISGVNTYWLRGYGDPPPQILIVLGYTRDRIDALFGRCASVAHVTNRYGVENEESHYQVFVCRDPRKPWPELWKDMRHFG